MPASIEWEIQLCSYSGTLCGELCIPKVIGAYAQQGRLLEASRWLGPLDFHYWDGHQPQCRQYGLLYIIPQLVLRCFKAKPTGHLYIY